MKYLISAILLIPSIGWSATQSQYRDGTIEFVSHSVNGKSVFGTAARDAEIRIIQDYNAKGGSVTVTLDIVTITPEQWEYNLSTCAFRWQDWPEYNTCTTSKPAVELKGIEVKRERDLCFPDSDRWNDLNNRYNWLLSYYNSLP